MPDSEKPWGDPRWPETQLDRAEQRLQREIANTTKILSEKIAEIKDAMNERLGRMESNIGKLEASKADKGDLATKSDRWVQVIVQGAIGLILVGFLSAVTMLVYNRPVLPKSNVEAPQ